MLKYYINVFFLSFFAVNCVLPYYLTLWVQRRKSEPHFGKEGCGPTGRVMPITGLAMVDCKILGRRPNNQRVKDDYPSLFWLNFFEKEDREALGGWKESVKQRRPLHKVDSELPATSAVNLGPPQQGGQGRT